MLLRQTPSIGTQLRQARLEQGLTQREVSQRSNVSIFTISGLENERLTSTSTHTIKGLQYALGVVFEI